MSGDQGFSKQEQQERVVAALRRERAGYVAAGKTARVEAVDADLERLGAKDDDTARKQAPQGRSAKASQQNTTD